MLHKLNTGIDRSIGMKSNEQVAGLCMFVAQDLWTNAERLQERVVDAGCDLVTKSLLKTLEKKAKQLD